MDQIVKRGTFGGDYFVWTPVVNGEEITDILGLTFNRITLPIAKLGFADWQSEMVDYLERANQANPEAALQVDAIHQYLQLPQGVMPVYLSNELSALRKFVAAGTVKSIRVVTEGNRLVSVMANVVALPLRVLKVYSTGEQALEAILKDRGLRED
jgi:hypothetical protein